MMAHQSWGSWEDLLLASAVKRHGLHNWDAVSTELRTTAQICQQKYHDLKRRFATPDPTPWLEDLRKVRVAELKRDLQRYDVSILALQLKVKRLEEERNKSLSATQEKPDLDPRPDFKHQGSQNDKSPAEIPEPGEKSVSGEEENQSVNGSNSTGSERREKEKTDPDLSSDMQSWASLERKRCGGDDDDDDEMKGGKSEASVGLLDKIRAHSESGLFASRLQITQEYKEVIRQHVDLETIQARAYPPSSLHFYRDLLLLFTNYIVFFPNLSYESRAAHQLRSLVLDHINQHATAKRSLISTKPSSDVQLETHTQSNDNDINNNTPAAVDVEPSLLEKPTTGTRSSRRSSTATATNNRKPPAAADNDTTPNHKQNATKTEKQDISPPTTKKKTPQVSASDKKKSVADFLKRIKKNSPEVTKKDGKGGEQKKNNGKEKVARRKQQQAKEETSPSKRAVGRPPKKEADRGGGSSSSSKEMEANPPRKRARR